MTLYNCSDEIVWRVKLLSHVAMLLQLPSFWDTSFDEHTSWYDNEHIYRCSIGIAIDKKKLSKTLAEDNEEKTVDLPMKNL